LNIGGVIEMSENVSKGVCLWGIHMQKDDCKKCYYPAFHMVDGKCTPRPNKTSWNTVAEKVEDCERFQKGKCSECETCIIT